MNEYKKVRLGDVLKTSSGGTPSKKNNDYYQNGTIPWILSGDISQGHIKFANNFITELGLEKSSAKYFPKNTILVAMYGATVGQVGVLDIEATTNQAICGIFPNEKFITNYIYYFFKSQKEYLLSMAIGGAQPNISQEIIKNLEIPLPPLETQKQIAATLDKVTKIISENKKLLEKYDLLIKSRFIEMFGDPVSNPMGWEVKKLGELLESIRYGTSTPPKFSESGYAFIRATNIKKGRIIDEDMKYISESESQKIMKCQLKGNEILIVRSGVNSGDTCVVSEKYVNQFAGYDMIIELGKNLNPIYLNELINTNYMDKIVKPLTRRAAQPHLNAEQTQSFPIILPPLKLQQQFATFVQQIDKSKFVVQKSLEKAETLYKSLMQEYFG